MIGTEKTIVVVSGLPRSGTSLMMKMLEAGGVPLQVDHLREADEDNPKGYYEFEPVKQLREGEKDWLPAAVGKAVKIVAPLLPHLPDGYHYHILFMRRAMPEILASQRKMLERRGVEADEIPDPVMAAAFEKHLAEVERWMRESAHVHHLDIGYADLVLGDHAIIQRIPGFLGRKLDVKGMSAVIDPQLYRQRAQGDQRPVAAGGAD